MNMFQRLLLFSKRKALIDKDAHRAQRAIKLSDNSYQIVWADEYDKWKSYLKSTGKIK